MALIKQVKGKYPLLADSVFLSDNSTIIGDVEIGPNSSVWFNTVIRGDVNSIRIGSKVNIQDGAIIHCTYKKTSTVIGNNVSIGHNAIVHGCKIEDNVLIGMGSIIMDGAIIMSNSIIAAGSVILEGTKVNSGEIYAGVPARKIKKTDKKNISNLTQETAEKYLLYSSWF